MPIKIDRAGYVLSTNVPVLPCNFLKIPAMAGAGVCFCLSRALGREIVEKLAGKAALSGIEHFFQQYGVNTVLICRLLPFVSFDAVSYFAGLTPMRH